MMRRVSYCPCVVCSAALVKVMGLQTLSPHAFLPRLPLPQPILHQTWLFQSLFFAQSISPQARSARERKQTKVMQAFCLKVFFIWKATFSACVSGSCSVRWLRKCKVFCWHAAQLFLAAQLLFIDWVGLQELGEMQK